MAGGIDISIGAGEALASGVAVATVNIISSAQLLAQQQGDAAVANGNATIPYRDPVQNKAATYSLLVPPSSALSDDAQLYVFDAVKVANHALRLNLTKAPLQTGYNIAYHAVRQQPLITLEIAMSDAIAAFAHNMWVGNNSKSISAFQTLEALMNNRQLIILSTRQNQYVNCMLIAIDSPETNETFLGLKATLTFEQVFLVGLTSTTTQSARPNATDDTQLAQVPPAVPSPNTLSQSTVTGPALDPTSSVGSIGPNGFPNGGQFSSLPLVIYDENGQDITYSLPSGPQ